MAAVVVMVEVTGTVVVMNDLLPGEGFLNKKSWLGRGVGGSGSGDGGRGGGVGRKREAGKRIFKILKWERRHFDDQTRYAHKCSSFLLSLPWLWSFYHKGWKSDCGAKNERLFIDSKQLIKTLCLHLEGWVEWLVWDWQLSMCNGVWNECVLRNRRLSRSDILVGRRLSHEERIEKCWTPIGDGFSRNTVLENNSNRLQKNGRVYPIRTFCSSIDWFSIKKGIHTKQRERERERTTRAVRRLVGRPSSYREITSTVDFDWKIRESKRGERKK